MTVTSVLDGPGAQHIDRIVSEVLAGVGRPAEIRLLAAADVAELIERGRS